MLARKHVAPIGLGLLLMLTACGAPAPTTVPGGAPEPSAPRERTAPKRMTAAIKSSPAYISDKVFAGAGGYPGAAEVEHLANAGLTVLDHQNIRRPQLAEAVPTVENGLWKVFPDGRMETAWKIRDGILWHDGAPFTAEDLVFTARVEGDRDLAILPSTARSYQSVDSVEAPDARTILVRWKTPYIFADDLFGSPLPRHLLESAYIADSVRLPELPFWTEEYVGTGPFKLRQFVRDSHLILEANDRYVLGRPKLDEIIVRFIPDSNTMGANVLAGEAELTMGRGLSLSEGVQIRDQWRDGKLAIDFGSWYALYAQSIDPNPAIIGDVQLRRALLHALDRQQMTEVLQAGLVPVADTYLSPTEAEYQEVQPSIVKYDYDPRKAAQMIGGLGYTKGPDGFFRDASGQRLALEVRSANEPEIDVNSNLTVRDSWRTIGVVAESELYSRQLSRDLQYRATFPGFQLQRQPNRLDALIRYHSSQAPLPESGWRGENKGRYTNPEMDALIDRFYTTIPPRERVQVLGQIIHHMTDRLHVMGLFYDGVPVLVGNRVKNVFPTNQAWNATEWDVQ